MHSRLQAWLSTGRISNLPTVWCNCLVILFLFLPRNTSFTEAYLGNHATSIALLLLSATCIYVGGCFQGDAFDVRFDKKYNPTRPIPSGILKHKEVLFASLLLLLGGIIFAFLANYPAKNWHLFEAKTSAYSATLLVLAITLYSWLHKRSAWFSLSLIAACRFALVLFASTFLTIHSHSLSQTVSETISQSTFPLKFWPFLLDHSAILWIGTTVGLYTICFASVARLEHTSRGISWASFLEITMLILPLPYLVLFYSQAPPTQDTPWLSLICFFFYASWIYQAFRALPRSKGQFVSQCLAGFCLLDVCFLSTSGLVAILWGILFFFAANGLQKIASAT